MVVIGLVGKLCSGKTMVVDFCNSEYNFDVIILEDSYPMESILGHLFFEEPLSIIQKDNDFYKQILRDYWNKNVIINCIS